MSEEQIEEYFKQKYGNQANGAQTTFEESDCFGISHQALLPCVKDPRIWILKCRVGDERDIVLKLLRKTFGLMNSDNVRFPYLLFYYMIILSSEILNN